MHILILSTLHSKLSTFFPKRRQKYTYPHNLGLLLITFFTNRLVFNILHLLKNVNQQLAIPLPWAAENQMLTDRVNVGDPATSCRIGSAADN